MTNGNSSETDRTKFKAIYGFARSLTVYGTPIFLALIGLYLIIQAFSQSFTIGLRSLAGSLFPLVMGSFLYVNNRELLRRTAEVSTVVGFLSGFAMGIILMLVLEVMRRATGIPVGEFVVWGCFSVLVFSSISSPGDKVFVYSYGLLSGLLVYVIVRGFPLAS